MFMGGCGGIVGGLEVALMGWDPWRDWMVEILRLTRAGTEGAGAEAIMD